ncbi:hypothetical protein GCM10017788_56060 [Amycolatopsis acidiphila]|nr:hypothetical protein GCM10017788_56060 [Amycolatopsis acidiphila]
MVYAKAGRQAEAAAKGPAGPALLSNHTPQQGPPASRLSGLRVLPENGGFAAGVGEVSRRRGTGW